MLHALGITHVVSVGECALIPPPNDGYTTYGHNQSGSYQMTASTCPAPGMRQAIRPGNGSLWVEEKEGRIKVLDIKVRIVPHGRRVWTLLILSRLTGSLRRRDRLVEASDPSDGRMDR